MGETASSGSAQGSGEPFAYTPDDVMEEGTRRFREQWPEKWEAWLRFCDQEDAATDQPTVAGTSGVLTPSERYDLAHVGCRQHKADTASFVCGPCADAEIAMVEQIVRNKVAEALAAQAKPSGCSAHGITACPACRGEIPDGSWDLPALAAQPSGLAERLRKLAALWDRQQAEYPPHGAMAAAAVRLCASELRDELLAQEDR